MLLTLGEQCGNRGDRELVKPFYFGEAYVFLLRHGREFLASLCNDVSGTFHALQMGLYHGTIWIGGQSIVDPAVPGFGDTFYRTL
jgi:hypothetical protein